MQRRDVRSRDGWIPSDKTAHLIAAVAITLSVGTPAFAQPAQQEQQPQQAQQGQEGQQSASDAPAADAPPAPARPTHFDIDEYRVDGADKLPQIDVEEAIYPFLGPGRTADDVEKARAALEKAYHDRGYQTVAVAVPAQDTNTGTIVLKVQEAKVGRLRVTNSRFFDVDKIKSKAPSLKEGQLPNFNNVTKDLVALNQWSDRRVTPALRAGVTPGTVDVDLNVEDKFPLHGSVEYNNRQSPNTTPTRLTGTVKYDNLWQLGHSLSMTYQVAPQRRTDSEAYSASYLARMTDWTSLLFYGVSSKSDVATVGGLNVVGPGEIFGARTVVTLPSLESFFHSFSFGVDYKHFGQTVSMAEGTFDSPITYYPLTATYGLTWQDEGALTQFNVGVTGSLRGIGSQYSEFDAKRYNANSSFFHINADLAHTQDMWQGFQLFGRLKGQYSDGPQVSSEQFSIGGADTVRGYYESEVIGDNGFAATAELRTPDVGSWLQSQMKDETGEGTARFTVFNEWRGFAFVDAGVASIYQPMAEQQQRFDMWSYGVGTRFKVLDHFNGMFALAVPMIAQGQTLKNERRVLFSVGGEF